MNSTTHRGSVKSRLRAPVALLPLCFCLVGCASTKLSASAEPGRATSPLRLDLPYERGRLDNGLEYILQRDETTPRVALDLFVHVGSAQDGVEHPGLAHLFEHLVLQGSAHLPEDGYYSVFNAIGGTNVNAQTNFERTRFYATVPSHQLEAALWILSDSVGFFLPRLTEERLRNQIAVVRNERRQAFETRPYQRAQLTIFKMLFPHGHGFHNLVIGEHEALSRITLSDAQTFYRTHYVSGNMTLVMAGRFAYEEARSAVERFFSDVPRGSAPPRAPSPRIALAQTKAVTVADELATLRQLRYAWHMPAFLQPEQAEVAMAADLLGPRGWLHRTLVFEKNWATSSSCKVWALREVGLLFLTITLTDAAPVEGVKALIREAIDQLASSPVSAADFQTSVVERELSHYRAIEPLDTRAEILHTLKSLLDHPDGLDADVQRFSRTTPTRIQEAARRWLRAPHVELLVVPGARP